MVDLIPRHGSHASAPTHQPKREYSKRDPRSARPWRRLREEVLKRDKYTCQGITPTGRRCGKVDADNEVDHIVPRARGGTDDKINLQTLCPLCHLMKSSGEAATKGASMTPEWMPRSAKPLVLVCGRPAAGKSHYVKEKSGRADLIVDLDLIAWEMRCKLEDLSKEQIFALIRLRNNRLAAFCRGETGHPRAFIVTTAGREFAREFWRQRGAEVVVIDTPLEVCQRRIVNEPISTERKQLRLNAAADWR